MESYVPAVGSQPHLLLAFASLLWLHNEPPSAVRKKIINALIKGIDFIVSLSERLLRLVQC